MVWVVASIVALCSLAGVVMTIITLPGTWFMLLVALAAKLVVPDIFSWWIVGVAGGCVLAAEVADFAGSVAGAKVGGAGKAGMTGALVGGILGAIAGTMVVPIIGTIVGGIVGAALLAIVLERNTARTWKESTKAGAGAAAGRVAATVVKSAFAIVMALTLSVAAFWPSAPRAPGPASGQPPTGSAGMIQPETP